MELNEETPSVNGAGNGTIVAAAAVGVLKIPPALLIFETDPKLEEEGTWLPITDGVGIRIRSQQSKAVRTIAQQLIQMNRAQIRVGAQLTPAQDDEQDVQLCAQALVTDWRGIIDGDGNVLACTEMNVEQIMRALPHLRRLVTQWSVQLENYRPVKEPKKA